MELNAISTAVAQGARTLAPRAERGVVLFVALIVLIIMTLAGLALLRQMGAGTSIAGNVAFKESATSVSDRGVEWGRNWVTTAADLIDDSLPTATTRHGSAASIRPPSTGSTSA